VHLIERYFEELPSNRNPLGASIRSNLGASIRRSLGTPLGALQQLPLAPIAAPIRSTLEGNSSWELLR